MGRGRMRDGGGVCARMYMMDCDGTCSRLFIVTWFLALGCLGWESRRLHPRYFIPVVLSHHTIHDNYCINSSNSSISSLRCSKATVSALSEYRPMRFARQSTRRNSRTHWDECPCIANFVLPPCNRIPHCCSASLRHMHLSMHHRRLLECLRCGLDTRPAPV
jgi:hypothetical protein